MTTYREHLASPAFMVIADGDCDQICGSKEEAYRERKDLLKMGCDKVTVKAFTTWEHAHLYEDMLRGDITAKQYKAKLAVLGA